METTADVPRPRCHGEELSCVEVTLQLISARNLRIFFQRWVLKWGEKGDGLDRVADMNSGAVKECLQVKRNAVDGIGRKSPGGG